MTTANENSLFFTVELIRDILEETIPAFHVTVWSMIFDGEAIISKKNDKGLFLLGLFLLVVLIPTLSQ